MGVGGKQGWMFGHIAACLMRNWEMAAVAGTEPMTSPEEPLSSALSGPFFLQEPSHGDAAPCLPSAV